MSCLAAARGMTPDGMVSACYRSGLVCNRCGGRARRPISDNYDWRYGEWCHTPSFGLMGHRCRLKPSEAPRGTGWTDLGPDPEVVAYQEAVTRLAWFEVELRHAARVAKEARRGAHRAASTEITMGGASDPTPSAS